ncbi:MAG: hypothetical protein Q9164_003881, partial [Protoblastenia rupestris]
MIIIGLTGSLATGKSTVSTLLRSPPYNLPIIDADILARQVVEPGTYGYNRVVATFGPTTPDLLLPTESSSSSDNQNEESAAESAAAAAEKSTSSSKKKAKKGSGGNTRERTPLNRPALGRRVFGSSPSKARDRKTLNGIIHPLVRLAMMRELLYYHFLGHWA